MKYILVLLIIMSFAFPQTSYLEPDEPDLTIPKPHYEYSIAWREWDDASHYLWVDGSNPKSTWSYHSRMFEDLEGLLKWLNSTNYYGEQKRIRLNDNQIIAIYDLTKAKKVKLRIVKTEIVEPYKVETKERKWTDVQWEIQ